MGAWLAENWWLVALLVAYVAERVDGVSAEWKARARVMADAIERAKGLDAGDMAGAVVKAQLDGDPLLGRVLDDGVDPKAKPRVSKAARVGRFLLGLVPLVSRVREAVRAAKE